MNGHVMVHGLDRKDDLGYHIRDSLSKFLAIPLVTLASFALLGLIAIAVERSSPLWLSYPKTR